VKLNGLLSSSAIKSSRRFYVDTTVRFLSITAEGSLKETILEFLAQNNRDLYRYHLEDLKK